MSRSIAFFPIPFCSAIPPQNIARQKVIAAFSEGIHVATPSRLGDVA